MKQLTIAEEIRYKKFKTRMRTRLEQWIVPSLAERGFRASYTNPLKYTVIYDSPECRIRFRLGEDQYQPEKDQVFVAYGRLKAPNDSDFIEKDGKRYKRAWFTEDTDQILDFLEGNDPLKVAQIWAGYKIRQTAWNRVYQQIKSIDVPSPFVRVLLYHDKIWQLYGEKLFSLFDMKNKKGWGAFQSFLENYYMELDYLKTDRDVLRSYGDDLYPWDID
jgi:hypothetical protein